MPKGSDETTGGPAGLALRSPPRATRRRSLPPARGGPGHRGTGAASPGVAGAAGVRDRRDGLPRGRGFRPPHHRLHARRPGAPPRRPRAAGPGPAFHPLGDGSTHGVSVARAARPRFPALCAELIAEDARDRLICDDVAEAVREGRSPVVLTERTGHAQTSARRPADDLGTARTRGSARPSGRWPVGRGRKTSALGSRNKDVRVEVAPRRPQDDGPTADHSTGVPSPASASSRTARARSSSSSRSTRGGASRRAVLWAPHSRRRRPCSKAWACTRATPSG